MTTISRLLSFFAALVISSVPLYGAILSGPVVNLANGHSYFLLNSNTWTASEAEAVALGGHLATIDNAAENDWVFDTFSAGERNLWIGLNDVDVNGSFTWVDGTTPSYFNWDTGPSPQPDLGNEHWVFIARGDMGQGLTARKWHDVLDDPIPTFPWIGAVFGVVEVPCYAHKATATASVVNGFLVGATITDGGCGYTNPPLVLVVGGGGSGATATATISEGGVVVGVNITANGSGYSTNPPPMIVFASPPFAPWLDIAVSKVKVTMHVVLGLNYVLESSVDLQEWTQLGDQFTAEAELIEQEFDVASTGRFFRIRQVP